MTMLSAFYSDLYAAFAVPATLTANGGSAVTVPMIDATRAAITPSSSEPAVMTVAPKAFVRQQDLTSAGVSDLDLDGAQITLNGRLWFVRSWGPRPCWGGDEVGDLEMMLTAGAATT